MWVEFVPIEGAVPGRADGVLDRWDALPSTGPSAREKRRLRTRRDLACQLIANLTDSEKAVLAAPPPERERHQPQHLHSKRSLAGDPVESQPKASKSETVPRSSNQSRWNYEVTSSGPGQASSSPGWDQSSTWSRRAWTDDEWQAWEDDECMQDQPWWDHGQCCGPGGGSGSMWPYQFSTWMQQELCAPVMS